jgi:hypothetical protein
LTWLIHPVAAAGVSMTWDTLDVAEAAAEVALAATEETLARTL